MSGFAGHISHLHEDPLLSFRDLRKIILEISKNELPVTEKFDGINIFFSFSQSEKEIKYLRNQTQLKNNGIRLTELIKHFSHVPNFSDVMPIIHSEIEKLLQMFSEEELTSIFGQNCDTFYNCEIVNKRLKNIITYNSDFFLIHRTGHLFKSTKDSASLNQKLFLMESKGFLINKYVSFLGNNVDFTNVLNELEQMHVSSGLSPVSKLYDYYLIKLEKLLSDRGITLPTGNKRQIIGYAFGIDEIRYNDVITKIPDKKIQDKILPLLKEKFLFKTLTSDIEKLLIKFFYQLTKTYKNSLTSKTNNQEIKQEFLNSIETLKNCNFPEAKEILNANLQKLENLTTLSVPMEGIVFNYKNKIFKLTGQFAPINQILNLVKYGRGKIPSLKGITKESSKNRVIGVFPGSFKPPHLGHFQNATVVKDLVDKLFVVISSKPRSDLNNELEISPQISLNIWNTFFKNDDKVQFIVSPDENPMITVMKLISKLNPGDTCLYVGGKKDQEKSTKRSSEIQKWISSKNISVNIKEYIPFDKETTNISSTVLREMILLNQRDAFFSSMPKHLTDEDKHNIWNLLITGGKKMKKVNETSSVSGGSIEGSPLGSKKNRISREDMHQFLKLKELVSKIIKEEYRITITKENKEKALLREKIREYLIQEAKSSIPDTKHSSTGINVLEDLLKKIVPQLEQDFKTLTTSPEQRDSYREHIINATSKSITAVDVNRTAGEEKDSSLMASLKEEDLTVNVDPTDQVNLDKPDEEKFIDIYNTPTDEKDTFTLPGKDLTGRNMAESTFNKIEKNIVDAYAILGSDEDKKLFYDYLLTNLKLYFNKFEDEIQGNIEEPLEDQVPPENDQNIPPENV